MNRSSVQARRHSTCMSIPRLRADARVETFTSRSRPKLSSRSRTSRRERGVDCSPGRSRLPRSGRVCAPVQLGMSARLRLLPPGRCSFLSQSEVPLASDPGIFRIAESRTEHPLESHHPRACRARQCSKERRARTPRSGRGNSAKPQVPPRHRRAESKVQVDIEKPEEKGNRSHRVRSGPW